MKVIDLTHTIMENMPVYPGTDPLWFGCFPIKLEDCDGAPIRAMAWME